MSYFMHANDTDTQLFALKAFGSICIRHYDFMLSPDLMNTYLEVLSVNVPEFKLKAQVSKKTLFYYSVSKTFNLKLHRVLMFYVVN